MTANELREELEEELRWRQEELAFFKNQLSNINSEEDSCRYRKSLVFLLYSHFEGYVKIALQIYIKYLNSLSLHQRDVIPALAAAGMHKEFLAYENLDRKCSVFRTHLPDDTSLHRFYRRVDFIEQMDEFQNKILHLEDTLIDTESNLWYVVLQKNLYKLGLSITVFEEHSSDIDALVNRRNSIAHGNSRAGVTEAEFSKWENKVYRMLSDITRLLYDYANHQRYLKTPPTEQ